MFEGIPPETAELVMPFITRHLSKIILAVQILPSFMMGWFTGFLLLLFFWKPHTTGIPQKRDVDDDVLIQSMHHLCHAALAVAIGIPILDHLVHLYKTLWMKRMTTRHFEEQLRQKDVPLD